MRISNIGRMTQRVTVQSSVLTPDGSGGNTEEWVNASTIWAEVLPGGSNRQIDGQQNKIFSDARFRVRTGNLSKLNRLVHEDRVYIIEGIRDWEQDREFQFIETRYSDAAAGISGDGSGGGDAEIVGGIGRKYLAFTAEDLVIQDNDLTGVTLINVYRNGIAPKIITSGSPSGSEVKFDSSSGSLTFGLELGANEYIYAIWQEA